MNRLKVQASFTEEAEAIISNLKTLTEEILTRLESMGIPEESSGDAIMLLIIALAREMKMRKAIHGNR